MLQTLKDQVVLITGGGSGLGRALVGRFLEEGCSCVGVLEKSAEKIAQLTADFGDRVMAIQGDVCSYEDNHRAVEALVTGYGKLDCFIGNAALWDHNACLLKTDSIHLAAAFDELISVNLKGYLLGAKAAAAKLVESEGSMIFTLSNAAFYTGGGGPLYTASKHGAIGLVRQLAYELAPKVRVNAVAPCGMLSDLRGPSSLGQQDRRITDTRTAEQLAEALPLNFVPYPELFTGPYVLLASRRDNIAITGNCIRADGGLGIRGIRRIRGEAEA